MLDPMPIRTATGTALLLLLAGAPALAQDTAQVQGYAPGRPAAAPPATLNYIFVPQRSDEAIRFEFNATQNEIREANDALARAEQERLAAKAAIEGKQQEINAINARISQADKEKREADKITLEADKKIAENQRKFFEKMEELRSTNVDLVNRRRAAAQASLVRIQLEQQLASQQSLTARRGPADSLRPPEVSYDPRTLELTKRVLEARKKELQARKDLADRELQLAQKRLDLFEAHLGTRGGVTRQQ